MTDEFVQAVKDAKVATQDKGHRKKARGKQQTDKRAAVAALNAQCLMASEAEVPSWLVTCEALAQEGAPKKSWPKKPSCPKKPKLAISTQAYA